MVMSKIESGVQLAIQLNKNPCLLAAAKLKRRVFALSKHGGVNRWMPKK
jgi:hypothetical protein